MVQPEFKYVHISCLLFTLLHDMWSKHVSILENSSHSNSPSLSPFLTCIWAACIICYEVIIFNAHQTATILMMHFFWNFVSWQFGRPKKYFLFSDTRQSIFCPLSWFFWPVYILVSDQLSKKTGTKNLSEWVGQKKSSCFRDRTFFLSSLFWKLDTLQ